MTVHHPRRYVSISSVLTTVFSYSDRTHFSEVSDRIFSTSVTCSYTLSIPSPLNISTLQVPFDKVFESVRTTTFKVFATDESASVQATMWGLYSFAKAVKMYSFLCARYNMCNVILADNKDIKDVSYSLPNKVRPTPLSVGSVDGELTSALFPLASALRKWSVSVLPA